MNTKLRTGALLAQASLIVGAVVILFPLVVAILSSLKNNKEIYSSPLGLDFSNLKFQNFVEAMNGPVGGAPLWTYFLNSVFVVIVALAMGMCLGILAAYGLARTSGRVLSAANQYLTVLIAIPVLSILVPVFNLMGQLNLRDNLFGVCLVYAALMIPTTTVLMRPFFAAIPAEVIEAAKIDGASEARTFTRVVLPMAFPTIVGIIVINAIWVWGELTVALVLLLSPSNKTLPVGLLAFQGQYFTNLGVQSAGLIIAALPMVVLYFFFSQRITQGVAGGGFK